jgi:protoheme ferro-lyase
MVDKWGQVHIRGITFNFDLTPVIIVTDCLETLEEIEIRGQQMFKQAGGERLTLIPCLNDDSEWVKMLAGWCQKNGIN